MNENNKLKEEVDNLKKNNDRFTFEKKKHEDETYFKEKLKSYEIANEGLKLEVLVVKFSGLKAQDNQQITESRKYKNHRGIKSDANSNISAQRIK